MKWTLIIFSFIITALLTAKAAESYGQVSLDTKVTLQLQNATLKTALKTLSEKAKVDFAYNTQILPLQEKVSVNAENNTLGQVLDKLTAPLGLTYRVIGKNIVIEKEPKKSENQTNNNSQITPEPTVAVSFTITGRITDTTGTPLISATVNNRKTNKSTTTDEKGEFAIQAETGDEITVSFIGYKPLTITANQAIGYLNLQLRSAVAGLKEVVVSTGYQTLPKERASGSFGIVDSALFNRRVGNNVLDRINGVATGLYFNGNIAASNQITSNPITRTLGINVRGVSTLSLTTVGTDPLIVLDNFPYEGDIQNINPNDIESVTILKDAAATSIWGARAGNGVIVLTSKKGRFNKSMTVEFNSNTIITSKPDVYKFPHFLNSSDFIDIENYLFNQGYYNSNISNTTSRPAVSPVVDILAKQKVGQLSSADATAQINALRGNDVRNDLSKYFYQAGTLIQSAIGIRGGTDKLSYALSVGYDNNATNSIRNGEHRTTINTTNVYRPFRRLEITTSLNYSQRKIFYNNSYGIGSVKLPYEMLADGNGNPLAITQGYRRSYLDSVQKLGFLDWRYKPLQDLLGANNYTTINDLLTNVTAKYTILPGLSIQGQYQNETEHSINNNLQSQDSYYVSNLINQFTIYNSTTKALTYQFPLGGILNLNNTDYYSNNFRLQSVYSKNFDMSNSLIAIVGAEIRQTETDGFIRTSYGYKSQFGTSNNQIDYLDFLPTNPSGSNQILSPDGSINGVTLRYISYYANAGYTFKDKYTINLSGRKDGSNIFGVHTNDRISPTWSAGGVWNLSKESFYHSELLPNLKLRLTYGYSGNVYNGTAYVTGRYGTANLTGVPAIGGITAPNPDLSWERVKTINAGADFSLVKNILSGAIDVYQKQGLNLIESIPTAPSTGFVSFSGNAAGTKTSGIELNLISQNLKGPVGWNSNLLLNTLYDMVTKYDVPPTSGTIQAGGGFVTTIGKPLYSIFAYKWAGLDPANGDPQGYLNGKVSKNYASIMGNFKPDSLQFFGSARPTVFGFFRNDFSYRAFSLSVNIGYKFGYYFRRVSTSLNLQDIVASPGVYAASDYSQRWQTSGDENRTVVPSVIYPSNSARNTFYQYSAVLVEKGDNIRLQDVRLSYDLKSLLQHSAFKSFQVYSYASNLGIIWRANKLGLDPDYYSTIPLPFTIAFGLNATF